MGDEDDMTDSVTRIMQGLQEAAEHARRSDMPHLALHTARSEDVAAEPQRTPEGPAQEP